MNIKDVLKDKKVFCLVDSDLDGTSCRVLLEYYVKPIASEFELVQGISGDPEKGIDFSKIESDYDVFLVADLGIEQSLYNRLNSKNIIVMLFDHHPDTRQRLDDFEYYHYHQNKCSALLLYEALTLGKRKVATIKRFIESVDIYDTWKKDSLDFALAQDVNHLLWSTKYSKGLFRTNEGLKLFLSRQIIKFEKYSSYIFTEVEISLIKKRRDREAQLYKKALKDLKIRTDSLGRIYGYFEIGSMISSVSNLILEKKQNLNYCLAYSTFNKNDGKFSLRSRENGLKMNVIALTWGGGGHDSASRFNLSETDCNKMKLGEIHPDFHLLRG